MCEEIYRSCRGQSTFLYVFSIFENEDDEERYWDYGQLRKWCNSAQDEGTIWRCRRFDDWYVHFLRYEYSFTFVVSSSSLYERLFDQAISFIELQKVTQIFQLICSFLMNISWIMTDLISLYCSEFRQWQNLCSLSNHDTGRIDVTNMFTRMTSCQSSRKGSVDTPHLMSYSIRTRQLTLHSWLWVILQSDHWNWKSNQHESLDIDMNHRCWSHLFCNSYFSSRVIAEDASAIR